MVRLIRAFLSIAVIAFLISLASGATAADPFPRPRSDSQPVSRPAPTVPFTATAYCQHGVTQSGVNTHSGIAAADPAQLPVGSVVHVETGLRKYAGIYTVLDTGSKVRGRSVDLFVHDCGEAQQFGRRQVQVTVLRRGWSPRASGGAAR